jgi:hypothetical protein
MATENPLIELVKALARRQARLDAIPPRPANENISGEKQATKQ